MQHYFANKKWVSNSLLTKVQDIYGNPLKTTKRFQIPEDRLQEIFRFGSLLDAMITNRSILDPQSRSLNDFGKTHTYTAEEWQKAHRLAANFWQNDLFAAVSRGMVFQHEVYRLNFLGT